MPELPDIVYIVKHLSSRLPGRRIREVEVKNPIVLRQLVPGNIHEILAGRTFESVSHRGPFFRFDLGDREIIVNLMLAGRFQLLEGPGKSVGDLCLSLGLDDGSRFNYGDRKQMGKIYIAPTGGTDGIPGYASQGTDILGEDFTFERFRKLMGRSRRQTRVFLMDQTLLSAVGNAYADEILFRAKLHPKTPLGDLSEEDAKRLYACVREIMAWGIAEVEKAARPIEDKVRDHMRVRGRKDQPCPECGSPIRRASVLGYDSFFCPRCQPPTRKQFIPW